jgi:enoyl-CoA hydratase/carnithine racemase
MTDERLAQLPQHEDVLLDARGSALVVTLHRPRRANALSPALMAALESLWAAVARAEWVRAVVLTGAGSAFCAGADVGMLADDRSARGATAKAELSFTPGTDLGVPVIVAVNGVCAGGGLHFVADGDIVIAAASARFLDPHVTVGQVSALEPLELLLKARRDAVVRMALLGSSEVLDAEAARAAGLVSEVVPDDDLLEHALSLAERIAAGSPAAVRATRKAIRDFEDELLTGHLDRGWNAIQAHWPHPDASEGPRAFMEKRTPEWAPRDAG